ncbi:MAG: DUF4148 domain-containing protein [Rubrivivax sp.]
MNRRHSLLLSLTTAVVFGAPALAQANSVWHPAIGEAGVVERGDHFKSTKTRAEVMAEAEAARKDGSLLLIERGLPLPAKGVGTAKTRQQVKDEMRSESPQDRRARMDLLIGG